MENVVYILGAGFSAPLGLPLISNFIMRAKDMFAEDSVKYESFQVVFDRIREMHVAKTYYSTDLLNIEEILSILEMRHRMAGETTRWFIEFLKDVISFYTPKPPPLNLQYSNWWTAPFRNAHKFTEFVTFTANLLNLQARKHIENELGLTRESLQTSYIVAPEAKYGVISLNYDRVLELAAELFCSPESPSAQCQFRTQFRDVTTQSRCTPLAKLHGSIELNNIIAPTWNKSLSDPLTEVWQGGLTMLRDANAIRIIGYSLPVGDSYIKYLLKAAIIETPNLKRIDVLCLDGDGSVRKRYDELISFPYHRFANSTTEDYLSTVHSLATNTVDQRDTFQYNQLEKAHEAFFSTKALVIVRT